MGDMMGNLMVGFVVWELGGMVGARSDRSMD